MLTYNYMIMPSYSNLLQLQDQPVCYKNCFKNTASKVKVTGHKTVWRLYVIQFRVLRLTPKFLGQRWNC